MIHKIANLERPNDGHPTMIPSYIQIQANISILFRDTNLKLQPHSRVWDSVCTVSIQQVQSIDEAFIAKDKSLKVICLE